MKTMGKYFRIIIMVITILQISSCVEEDAADDTLIETTGQAMFWTASDLGVGSITVSCNGITKTINSYSSSGAPTCGASGAANFSLNPGTYSYNASAGSKTWNGSIVVTSGGCSKMQLTGNVTGGNLSLNGKWSASDGRIITISGSSGVFNSFGSGSWKSAADKGFVKLGDLYLKNISNVNSTKWNAIPLWVRLTNGVANAIQWGTDGTIIMSSDGKTISLTGTSPWDTGTKSVTFTRIN